jgi:hypothetical protein
MILSAQVGRAPRRAGEKEVIGLQAMTPTTLAHRWREALVNRRADEFAGLFAEDALFIDVEHRTPDLREPRPIRGRAEIAAVTRSWFDTTPSFRFELVHVLSDATTAAFLWNYEVPGVKQRVAIDGVTWLSCAGGLIDEAHVHFDSYALLTGLGITAER